VWNYQRSNDNRVQITNDQRLMEYLNETRPQGLEALETPSVLPRWYRGGHAEFFFVTRMSHVCCGIYPKETRNTTIPVGTGEVMQDLCSCWVELQKGCFFFRGWVVQNEGDFFGSDEAETGEGVSGLPVGWSGGG